MKTWLLVLFIFAAGLFLRLDQAWTGDPSPMPDSIGYQEIASSLASGDGFQLQTQRSWDQPASNYSPGVPLLLGGFYLLAGSDNEQLGRLLLAFLGALAIVAVFLLGRELAGPGAGLVAAAVVAFYPTLIADSGMILTEGLAGLLLALALLFSLRSWWLLAGLLWGLAVLVRPEFLFLFLPLLLLFCWRERGARPLLLGASFLLLLLPWSAYISSQTERFVPVSTGGGQVLFTGSYLPSEGNPQNLLPQLLQEKPWLLQEPLLRDNPPLPGQEIPVDQVLAALALAEDPGAEPSATLARLGQEQYLEASPPQLATLMVQKFQQIWLRGRSELTSGVAGKSLHLSLVMLAALGVWALWQRGNRHWIVFLLMLLITTAGALLLVASPRRVLAIWPVVATLGGAGGWFLLEYLKQFYESARSRETKSRETLLQDYYP